jgi:hypothetical protein
MVKLTAPGQCTLIRACTSFPESGGIKRKVFLKIVYRDSEWAYTE